MTVIGGRAHLDGISFITNTHVVRGRLTHGTLSIKVRRLPGLRIFNLMDKVPFLRGISRIAKLNLELFLGIILLLAIPWDWIFPSDDAVVTSASIWSDLAIYAIVLLVLVILLKRLWQFHGAEHKAFNIYLSGGDLSLSTVKQASRVSERCGTNLAVVAIPIIIVLTSVTIPILILVIALPVGYEILNWSSRKNRLKPAYLIASFIQRYIVTAEPTEEQVKLATATLVSALECHLDG